MKDILDFKSGSYSKEITRDFFKSVYTYMFAALAVSGFIAYMAGTPEFFSKYFVTEQGTLSPLIYVAMFAPVGLGILIQMAYQRLSLGLLIILFMMYSVLMGVSLSTIMLVYSIGAIASTFFITAGAFAAMAILGYTTKVDLTKFGSLMYMLFIGIFIAGIVNIFMQSEMMQFVISFIGVFVFTGLTAYYMQQLKTTAQNEALSEIDRNKLSLVGGLMLYILFINLFMSLLSLLGGRD
jgi:FtsH-binding integral membrane protein